MNPSLSEPTRPAEVIDLSLKREMLFFSLIFAAFGAVSLYAEDRKSDLPPDLTRDSLYIVIRPSLSGPVDSNVPLAYPVVTKQTMFGKAITLKINTNDGKLIINFTPYITADNTFNLVAECQIWTVTDNDGTKTWQYFTYFSSIPLEFGDKAMFYPLGRSDDDSRVIILMEIVCVPYQWIVAGGQSPEFYLDNAGKDSMPVIHPNKKTDN